MDYSLLPGVNNTPVAVAQLQDSLPRGPNDVYAQAREPSVHRVP